MRSMVIATLAVCLANTAWAESPPEKMVEDSTEERANSVNLSPLGVLFGSYTLNYERLFEGTHGLLAEASLSSAGDEDTSSLSYGGTVGYRWHWSDRQNSGFLGLNAGYGVGSGTVEVTSNGETASYDLDIQSFSVVPNVGKRWAWASGLNLTIRGGIGYGNHTVSTSSDDEDAQDAADTLQGILEFLPVAVDAEVSIGWTF